MNSDKTVVALYEPYEEPEPGPGKPHAPTNLTPADGARGINLKPELTASPFKGARPQDKHAASHWQVTNKNGNYAQPVFDDSGANLTRVVVDKALSSRTTYYWRVSYKDSNGKWSDWSRETSFVTSGPPQTPSAKSPADGATFDKVPLGLECSPFSDKDPGDSHQASQWQLTAVRGDYSDPLLDSGETSDYLTSFLFAGESLAAGETYYWRVRHKDSQGNWSPYSKEASFTIEAPTPTPPPKPDPGPDPDPVPAPVTEDPPVPEFTCTPAVGSTPLQVTFADTSSGKVTSWEWDFDSDGTIDSTEQNPSFTFDSEGVYNVTLKVTGPGGTNMITKPASVIVEAGGTADDGDKPVPRVKKVSSFPVAGVSAAAAGFMLFGGAGYFILRRHRV